MEPLHVRIHEKLAELTNERDGHLAAAQRLDGLISKLGLLAEGEEDPDMERLLIAIVTPPVTLYTPGPMLVAPQPFSPPVNRIHITADKVYAATQTMEDLFTLSQLTDLICDNENVTDVGEKTRVRSAISSMLSKLVSNGRAIHVEKGRGKQRGTFRKVCHKSPPGYKNGAPADIVVNFDHVEEVVE